MTPLKTFHSFIKELLKKPFSFWDKGIQENNLQNLQLAIQKSKTALENDNLKRTKAYTILNNLESLIFFDGRLNELVLLEDLAKLLLIYKATKLSANSKLLVDECIRNLTKVMPSVEEYYFSMEILEGRSKKMTEQNRGKSDLKIIQEIGVFYILEYTLYVLHKLSELPKEDKQKILYEGLKTKEGNFPSYIEFSESFRRELGYKLFDETLRNRLLKAFYDFEEILQTRDLTKVYPAFKRYNLELLHSFKDKGLKMFKAKILTPFGQEISMDKLISIVEGLKID